MLKYLKKIIPKSLLISNITNVSNSVFLTFDDGPNPDVTPKVLGVLQRYDARAVFFIPGLRIERAPYLLRQLIEDGHEIGNHTFIHKNGKQPAFFAYLRDIEKCQKEIEISCGVKPRLFRPPCGIISPTTLLAPILKTLQTVTWSIDSQDWRCRSSKDADAAAEYLLQVVQPGDIILLHDDNPYVVSILEIVLPVFQARGFEFNKPIIL